MRSMCWPRTGRAAIGDLRYYAETKLDAFATPLAKAQIGAALALYGDQPRADAAFRAALGDLDRSRRPEQGWRSDYGTEASRRGGGADARRRDAGAASTSSACRAASSRSASRARYTSTQENAWMLLAALR